MSAKILFMLILIATITAVPAFAENLNVVVKGLNTKVNYALDYESSGATIEAVYADLDSISLIFEVSISESHGDITIEFDRNIFDAKIGDNDDDFFIISDGEEIKFDEEKSEDMRMLSFSVPQGTEEFEIFGTMLFGESFLLNIEEAAAAAEEAKILADQEERKEFYKLVEEMEANVERINERIAEELAAEAEQARITALAEACGEGTIFLDGECVNQGLIGPQPESIESGPLINSIFAAMGIGLAVMIILWGIGRSRHKKLSVVESDDS